MTVKEFFECFESCFDNIDGWNKTEKRPIIIKSQKDYICFLDNYGKWKVSRWFYSHDKNAVEMEIESEAETEMSKSIIEWHKIKTRPLNDEEKEHYGDDISFIFDCKMPEDGQEILIATEDGTDCDICWRYEYRFELERCGDWEDILAWAEFPRYESEVDTE